MLKPNTSHTQKVNYRPIVIMNIDTNFFKKLVQGWIQQNIKDYIACQICFIPETQGWFNIRKAINIKYHLNRIKHKNHMMI